VTKAQSPLLVVLTGPSGAGKDSLLARLKSQDPSSYIVVNVTTRPPRAGEQEGVDYHFVSKEEFERLYNEAEIEMHSDDFRALWYFLTVWGTKSNA